MTAAFYLVLAFIPIGVSMAACVAQETSVAKSNVSIDLNDDHLSSWARLQIASNAMASMPYNSYRINIYEHSNNNMPGFHGPKRYYYAPIVLLDHSSAYSYYNNVTNEPELLFQVEMWNEDVEEKIVKYINLYNTGDPAIFQRQVEIIPFDKVILSSSTSSTTYTLVKEWTPYQFQRMIWFRFICFSMTECDNLAENMKSRPDQFYNLKLFFSQSAQKTQRRETVIRVDNIMAGEMAAKLDQRYSNKPDALLTAKDEKRLLTESSTNVLIDSFDDSEVVSPTTEAQIYNMLKDMLVSSRSIIKDQSDTMWESVFWDDDNYRPDKTTKTWSELYQTQEKEVQKKMAEAFTNTNKVNTEISSHIRKSGFTSAVGVDTSKSGSKSKEEIDKLYVESKDSVEWQGEKFTPKSMALSRINMNNLRNTQTLEDRNVRVSYSTAVLSVALNIRPYTDKPSSDQLFYLQAHLKEMEFELNKTKAELASVKSDVKAINPPKPVSGPMPTSCKNYKTMGHALNGFYLVTGSSNQVKTIYCDFSKTAGSPGYEKWIGKVDIKTMDVHFYVQRNRGFSAVNAMIPFDTTKLNVGGAMNLTSGIFTAPVSGTYHFEYTGVKESSSSSLAISLQKNGGNIGHAWTENGNSASLSASLKLKSGDTVNLFKSGTGVLHDSASHNTHFTGWLVDEDLVVA